MVWIYRYYARIVWFFEFCFFLALADNSSELESVWQVSDGLSKKKFLESHRAPRAYTQISKTTKHDEFIYKWSEYTDIMHELCDFEFCVFLALADNSSELESVWQVSDGLSKKIFWNPTELLVLTHKSQKLQNMTKLCTNCQNILV